MDELVGVKNFIFKCLLSVLYEVLFVLDGIIGLNMFN